MKTEIMLITLSTLTIAILLLSTIYAAGVVWRVEKELDTAYKFFLAAIILLTASEILSLYYPLDNFLLLTMLVKLLRLLFAGCFLAGILFMRDIARKLDGEKKKKK